MKKGLFLFMLLLMSYGSRAQADAEIYTIVDQMPAFPEGEVAMNKYIQKNIVYPKNEKEFGVDGTIYLTFVVKKDGSIGDIKCLRGVKTGPNLEKEAIRVIQSMPKWKPGMLKGKAVNVQYQLPIKFKIDKKMSEEQLQTLSKNHYKKGLELMAKSQFQEALDEFDYCVFFMPSDVNALYQRGMAYHGLKDDKKACDEWTKIQFEGSKQADEVLLKYCK